MMVTNADGSLYFVSGASGGSRIITATLQSVINVIDRGMGPLHAISEPRFHDQLIPNNAAFEDAFDHDTIEFMRGRGHNITGLPTGLSAVQCIRLLPNGTFEAASEPRQRNSGGYAI